jgi:hypothetical protein
MAPDAESFVTKASSLKPLLWFVLWNGVDVGKSVERVVPATNAAPAASTSTSTAPSELAPPRNVE